jgi:hypothetical protein
MSSLVDKELSERSTKNFQRSTNNFQNDRQNMSERSTRIFPKGQQRTFRKVKKEIFRKVNKEHIHGIFEHCT